MKRTPIFLTIALTIALGNVKAQNVIEVNSTSYDISDNLDLKAVASIFGDSENLNDFEKRLNEAGNDISNLDLNEDGYVDYLRVIEHSDKGTHLITIQAVLGDDLFQDVATIELEKQYGKYSMIIVGNHFIYGNDYFLRPVYVHRPSIFGFFFGSYYKPWHSPYYWGYYPTYYTYRTPYPIYRYRDHIHGHINIHHHYEYMSHWNHHHSNDFYAKYSRNDYGSKHPEKSFEKRNDGAKNSHELIQNRRSSQPLRSGYNNTEKSTQYKSEGNRRAGTVRKTTDDKPVVREKSAPTQTKSRSNSSRKQESPKVNSSSQPRSEKVIESKTKKTESSVKRQPSVKKVETKSSTEKKPTENKNRR